MQKALKIRIDDIPEEGLSLSLGPNAPIWQDVAATVKDEGTLGELRCELFLSSFGGQVSATGQLHGDISVSCARCLENVPVQVEEAIALVMIPPPEVPDGSEVDVELTEDALECGFLEGREVNVTGLLAEHLLLAMPSKVLCRPDCAGICQFCGAELNHEPCRCDAAPVDPRFSLLKSLKLPPRSV